MDGGPQCNCNSNDMLWVWGNGFKTKNKESLIRAYVLIKFSTDLKSQGYMTSEILHVILILKL